MTMIRSAQSTKKSDNLPHQNANEPNFFYHTQDFTPISDVFTNHTAMHHYMQFILLSSAAYWCGMVWYSKSLTSHSTQYRSFRRREGGGWAVMCTSHSVMEGQRHNDPLTRIVFVYNGPKEMELAPNPRYSGGS